MLYLINYPILFRTIWKAISIYRSGYRSYRSFLSYDSELDKELMSS
uniref:Uncharacterized protein n=1 Tax=Arundo donax TaxID=35708 RepID=A0A0A9FZB5_ARUDO